MEVVAVVLAMVVVVVARGLGEREVGGLKMK